jgi:hypothetical protein
MQPLNAIDAIAPAFTRAHQTLFHPFRIGRSWKLAASQYLGFCGAMFVPLPLFLLLIPAAVPIPRPQLFLFSLIPTILTLIILYLCGRMEMVCFEMLVTRGKFIAPMWRRYSARVWPWIGLKILVGTVVTLLFGILLAGPLRHAVQNMIASFPAAAMTPGSTPDPAEMQALMAPFIQQISNFELILFAIVFLLKIPSTLLNDFVIPFYILEDIPLMEAIRRGFEVFVADPLQVILYLILKPILFVIGYFIQNIVIFISLIPFLIVLGIGAIVGGVSLHGSGASASALLLIAGILFYIVFLGFIFWEVLGVFGYLLTLLEAYGIYFLAGRYPLLASLLEPGPDKPFTPPPVFPSEEERRDSSGGPPMPMDPAVA